MSCPWWLSGKESACNAGDSCSISELGRSPGEGNGNPFQYSYLENPRDRGAWWSTVHGIAKIWTQLSDHHFPPFSSLPNNVMHWTRFTKQYYMHYLPYSTTQISSNMKINSSFTRPMNSRMRNKMLSAWLSVTCRSLQVSFVELTRPTTCSLSFPATLWWKLGWCFSLCLLHEYIGIHIQWLCECPMASEG